MNFDCWATGTWAALSWVVGSWCPGAAAGGSNQPLFSWQRPALRPVYRRDLLEDEEIIVL
jgi:hypothetical protein